MKTCRALFLYCVTYSLCGSALAYDPDSTHLDLTKAAFLKSAFALDATLASRIGFPQTIQRDFIAALIQDGSRAEDAGTRSLNHFYDVVNDRPLTVLVSLGARSPDWALEDVSDIAEQSSSYKDAKEAYYQAHVFNHPAVNAEVNAAAREGAWTNTFAALGHVLHHMQDMGQPQHVRNDAHCDAGLAACYLQFNPSRYERYSGNTNHGVRAGITRIANGPEISPVYPEPPGPSTFRTPRDFWVNNRGTGIAEYSNQNFVSQGTNFLMQSGQPVAAKYRLPVPINRPTDLPIAQAYADAGESVPAEIQAFCANAASECLLRFYPTDLNPRAATLSLFDQDLTASVIPATYSDGIIQPTYSTDRVFSLNRFNFDAVYPLLIPKAVSYGAGLINFFFRGRLEISLPDEGVYGIIDHNIPLNSDPATGGFARIKLKLKNVTPGSDSQGNDGAEKMAEGGPPTLIAIAKFHRNTCYKADLSGEMTNDGSANDWRTCRSKFEEIVISDSLPAPIGINTSAQQVTFNFTTNKIPISATDLYIQVVYRGPLGQETDAVVVATKDISEPTYIQNYSRKDQYTYCSYCVWPILSISLTGSSSSAPPNTADTQAKDMLARRSFAEWCNVPETFATQRACNEVNGYTMKLQYSSSSSAIPGYEPSLNTGDWADYQTERPFSPVATLAAPVGTYARVAVLFDAVPTNPGLEVLEAVDTALARGSYIWWTGSFTSASNQVDTSVTPNTFTPAMTYLPGRGVFMPAGENWLLISGDAPSIPPLVPISSQINF